MNETWASHELQRTGSPVRISYDEPIYSYHVKLARKMTPRGEKRELTLVEIGHNAGNVRCWRFACAKRVWFFKPK